MMMNTDKVVNEVLDSDGNLMGKSSMGPENNRNNITKSNKITDYNINVGRQKFGQDFLGRFGFHFYEGKETEETKLIDLLAEVEFNQYKGFLEYFIENFSKENLKIWKDIASKDFKDLTDEEKKSDYGNAFKVVSVLKKYIKDKKGEETITEDIITDKPKNDSDIVNKFFKSIKKDDRDILTNIKEKVDKLLNDCKK
jgi:hypothetical protein